MNGNSEERAPGELSKSNGSILKTFTEKIHRCTSLNEPVMWLIKRALEKVPLKGSLENSLKEPQNF